MAVLKETNYHDEQNKQNILKIRAVLDTLPSFCKDFFRGIENYTSTRTRLAYAYDLRLFFEFLHDNKIVYTTVYKKDLEKYSAGDDYTDGIAEALRAIDSTEVSFVVKEVESKLTKVSMRSKKIDVAKICEQFGGGGHTFAAGCTIKASIKDSIKKLLKEIEL